MSRSAATTQNPRFTREDYAELPEGFPAELVEGRLVKIPTPLYGESVLKTLIFRALVETLPKEFVPLPGFVSVPIDFLNVYQPHVAVFRGPVPMNEGGTLVPAVVFEVVTVDSSRDVLETKRRKYLTAGVEEVWLLDHRTLGIEAHTRAGVDAGTGATRVSSSVLPGFSLVPKDLFADWIEPPPAAPAGS